MKVKLKKKNYDDKASLYYFQWFKFDEEFLESDFHLLQLYCWFEGKDIP